MEEFYFIFRDGKNFFSKFLKEGFGHCLIIYNYLNLYIMIENNGVITEITPILCDINEVFDKLKKDFNAKIVKINKKDNNFNYKNVFNLFPSCVNFSKVVSCYRSKAQTPYSLYKDLIKNGGVEI